MHDDATARRSHIAFQYGYIWIALAIALGAGFPLGAYLAIALGVGFPLGGGVGGKMRMGLDEQGGVGFDSQDYGARVIRSS